MVDRENLTRPAMPPLDPQVVTDWGTTTAEQLAPEPLDDPYTDRPFLEPGADGWLDDDGAYMLGDADAGFGDSLSAEEAAMRVVDEPPGMNYDPDPGYLDHSRD